MWAARGISIRFQNHLIPDPGVAIAGPQPKEPAAAAGGLRMTPGFAESRPAALSPCGPVALDPAWEGPEDGSSSLPTSRPG